MGLFSSVLSSPEFRDGPIPIKNLSNQMVILSGEWSMCRKLDPGCSIGIHDPNLVEISVYRRENQILSPSICIGKLRKIGEGSIGESLIVKLSYDDSLNINGVTICYMN